MPAAGSVVLVLWMAVVALRGSMLVAQGFGVEPLGAAGQGFATPQLVIAAGLVLLFCLLAAVTARRFRPSATVPVACASAGLVLLAAAIGSGSLGPLLLVLVLFAVTGLLGRGVLRRLPSPLEGPVVGLPVAVAVGVGLIGLPLFLLAALATLNATTVLVVCGAILASVVLLDRRGLAADVARLRSWHPEPPSWWETVVIGLTVGVVGFALLSAFVPENTNDASNDHLPIAREFWQSMGMPVLPQLGTRRPSIQGHLLYAVAYGLAGEGFPGMMAAKMVHAGVGLAAIVGVVGVGSICAGRLAGVIGAALVATTPLVLWTLGHAMVDLFPVLFTVSALLCLLQWQRVGAAVWLVVAGALAGFGFVVQETMGLVAVALAAALFLVGRRPWRTRERLLTVLAFGLGTVVVVPWLVRAYSINETLPGFDRIFDVLTHVMSGVGGPSTVGVDGPPQPPPVESVGPRPRRDVVELVQLPWRLTFHIGQRGHTTLETGPIGIAPLLLLPLALLAPRTRAVAMLAVVAVVSFVGWWLTPLQVVRHFLPTLAVVAVLIGLSVAAIAGASSGPRHTLSLASGCAVLGGLIAGFLLFLPEEKAGISIDRIVGRETEIEYVQREIPAASLLLAASGLLPPDTLVGYVGGERARIYTEVQLLFFDFGMVPLPSATATPAAVLAFLDQVGIKHFIWERRGPMPGIPVSTLVSTGFLRDHTRILAGDSSGYLFEVLPDGGAWGEPRLQDLLADPDLNPLMQATTTPEVAAAATPATTPVAAAETGRRAGVAKRRAGRAADSVGTLAATPVTTAEAWRRGRRGRLADLMVTAATPVVDRRSRAAEPRDGRAATPKAERRSRGDRAAALPGGRTVAVVATPVAGRPRRPGRPTAGRSDGEAALQEGRRSRRAATPAATPDAGRRGRPARPGARPGGRAADPVGTPVAPQRDRRDDGAAPLVAEQRVPVAAGVSYLLEVSGSCARPAGRADLALRWFDGRGAELGVDAIEAVPGVEPGEMFLWRRAPPGAASVSVELWPGMQCKFTEAAFYRLSPRPSPDLADQ